MDSVLKSKGKGPFYLRLRMAITISKKTSAQKRKGQSAPLPLCCMPVIVTGSNARETWPSGKINQGAKFKLMKQIREQLFN